MNVTTVFRPTYVQTHEYQIAMFEAPTVNFFFVQALVMVVYFFMQTLVMVVYLLVQTLVIINNLVQCNDLSNSSSGSDSSD